MFENIIGHDRVKAQLQHDLEKGNLHQSYVLSGPEHVGKMSLLRELMSQSRSGQAFDPESSFGKMVLEGRGSGLMSFLDDGSTLKVEQMRSLQDFISRRGADDQFTFCVIEHVERMTISASNAFLKMLEEPSERFVFLMTTREEHALLLTIRSRVQIFRCQVPSSSLTQRFLEKSISNPLELEELMRLSLGRVGWALRLHADEELLKRARELYDYARLIFENDLVDRFQIADHMSNKDVSQVELQQFLSYLTVKLRDEGVSRVLKPLEKVQELQRAFRNTQINKRLALESLFLEIMPT